jgi:hypothetical protein
MLTQEDKGEETLKKEPKLQLPTTQQKEEKQLQPALQ